MNGNARIPQEVWSIIGIFDREFSQRLKLGARDLAVVEHKPRLPIVTNVEILAIFAGKRIIVASVKVETRMDDDRIERIVDRLVVRQLKKYYQSSF